MKNFVRVNGKIYDVKSLIAQVKAGQTIDEEKGAVVKFATSDNEVKYMGFLRRIFREADSIHELVDAYWWENDNYKDPIFTPTYWHAKDRLKAWLNSDKELKTNNLKDITIYGSIYINGQGWKHVSKLTIDENGEFKEELICRD